MKVCPRCEWEVPEEADVCPHCGEFIGLESKKMPLRKVVEKGIESIDADKVEAAEEKSKAALELAEKLEHRGGKFKKLFNRIEVFVSLLKDYKDKKYQDVPWTVIAAVVFAIIYFVSPIDAIPDFLPLIGWVDDVAVILLVLASIEHELRKYLKWKGIQSEAVF